MPHKTGAELERRAQSDEPTLFPKLRIDLADFPRAHLFIQLEIVHLEDLLR